MDPAPRAFTDLPRDRDLGLPVPFACGTGDSASAELLDPRRVTQCALSRVCGVCGAGLGRPIAFLGSQDEVDRNAFHFPPTHLDCARQLLSVYADTPAGVERGLLGQPAPVPDWVLVTTSGFEFVRPGREQGDRRPTFEPNSLLGEPVADGG